MKFLFRWYDFYQGLYYDRKRNYLYIFPVPMLGVRLKIFQERRLAREQREHEEQLLMEMYDANEPIRFKGYDDQQLCKKLREDGLAEWMTWESHNPYYFLTDEGKEIAKKLWDDYWDKYD